MAIKKTADLVDGYDEKLTFCDYPLTKFGRAEGFEGEIVTLKTFEDNALLREVLEQPGNGRVLVVDGGASTRVAIVGDQIAALGMNNGWAGLVLNGSIRDSVDIDAMDYAVFAVGTSPKKSTKTRAGFIDVPVTFGDMTFTPGHYLYADADGILVSEKPVE
jgi:regulator of ribonuclease activity A|tara:strand:+ start:13747 stop:14229 length:483 start_codon:yes stop_codon:yes gene_type:complete